jgi:hypothetical protein
MKVLAFSLLLFVIDRSVFFFIQKIRPIDYKYFLDSRKEYLIKGKEIEILILGDSHIADALDPQVIEDSCKLKTYNMGIYHSGAYENYHLLKHILTSKGFRPKVLIIGTDPIQFSRAIEPGQYTPLIINNFRDNFKLYAEANGFDFSYIFKTVQEKYLFLTLFKRLIGIKYTPTREIKRIYNGYLENHRHDTNSNFSKVISLNQELNQLQKDYFEKTLNMAYDYNIVVILVNPPVWKDALQDYNNHLAYKEFGFYLKAITEKYNCIYFNQDNSFLGNSLKKTDFLNSQHVNYYGAKLFSQELGHFLKNNLP